MHKVDLYGYGEGTLTYEIPQNLLPTQIYSPDEVELLVVEMKKLLPNRTNEYYAKQIRKYTDLLHDYILIGLARGANNNMQKDYGHFSYKEIRHQAGRYSIDKKQYYWFDFFERVKPTLIKIKQGYKYGDKKGMLTMSRVNMDPSVKLSTKNYFSKFHPEDILLTPINMQSLRSYITKTRLVDLPQAQELHRQKQSKGTQDYIKSIQHNLSYAENIELIASEHNNHLPQIRRPSKFGRLYLGGINLVNASKRVRQAALGDCWAFDIEASAITWKYIMCKSIDPSIKLPETLDYMDHKTRIRANLCQRVFGNSVQLDIIKEVISAVGFGARTNIDGWIFVGMDQNNQAKFRAKNAITSIIRSKEHRTRLLEDSWFKAFAREQQAMDQIIASHYKRLPKFKKEPFFVRGRWRDSTLLSCLYQFSERQILNLMVEEVNKQQPGNVLLTCHDGFYTRYKPDISSLQCILGEYWSYTDTLRGYSSIKAHLDYEQIRSEYYSEEEHIFIMQHKAHMEAEYAKAEQFYNKSISRPKPMKIPKLAHITDHDRGYDDGTRAYDEPNTEFWDEVDSEYYEEYIRPDEDRPVEEQKFYRALARTRALNQKEE